MLDRRPDVNSYIENATEFVSNFMHHFQLKIVRLRHDIQRSYLQRLQEVDAKSKKPWSRTSITPSPSLSCWLVYHVKGYSSVCYASLPLQKCDYSANCKQQN
jgi:hypothetical protein